MVKSKKKIVEEPIKEEIIEEKVKTKKNNVNSKVKTKEKLDNIKTTAKKKKEKITTGAKNKINSAKNYKKKVVKPRKKKTVLKIILLALLFLFVIGIICCILFFSYIVVKAPEFNDELLYKNDPTVILDKNGKEIGKVGREQRTTISYDEMSETLIDAIIATEDSRFFEHKGVDWARFMKASVGQVLGNSNAGGASTITMQVSKNAFTSTEASGIQGIIRKFTDIYLSIFKIEKNYTKEQIMEFYINSYYLGNGAYGVEQASITYFGKHASDLNLNEASMIAGLFQAPGSYDPYKNIDKCEARRKIVLSLMLRHGYISKDEYKTSLKVSVADIISEKKENQIAGVSEYQTFIDTVIEEVEEKTGVNPYTTSMTIYSTMDTSIQDYINKIMNGNSVYQWPNDETKAGIAITNVKTGAIVALGGARNVDKAKGYNYATDIKNQIGSTAKPLYDYGPAIEYLHWGSGQPLVDDPTKYSDGHDINNFDGRFQGMETARIALAGSRNIPALKTFRAVPKDKIVEFTTNLGLSPEVYSCDKGYTLQNKKCIKYNDNGTVKETKKATVADNLHEAHSIGGYNGESPLTMSAAYAAFGNGGKYTTPYSFTELIYEETGEKYVNKIETKKAMSEETAYIVSNMLQTTRTQALGKYANANGVNFAAKTGTTNYDSETLKKHHLPSNVINDFWVVGYNTEYSIGVWVGYDDLDGNYHNIYGTMNHARLMNAVASKVFTNKSDFKRPSGVVSVTIETQNPESMLPSANTPDAFKKSELYVKGYEPTTVSTRFKTLNDVSNLTAEVDGEKIIISWKGIDTPDAINRNKLTEQFKKLFSNTGYMNNFINSRIAYMGDVGYNVYLKNSSGNLELLNFTKDYVLEYTPDSNGTYEFVVKSTYSTYKGCISKGVSASVSFNNYIATDIPDIDDDNEPEPEDNPEI